MFVTAHFSRCLWDRKTNDKDLRSSAWEASLFVRSIQKLHNLQNISACYFLFNLQIRCVKVHFDLPQSSSPVLFADELELYDQDMKERKLGLATGEIKLNGRLQRFVLPAK